MTTTLFYILRHRLSVLAWGMVCCTTIALNAGCTLQTNASDGNNNGTTNCDAGYTALNGLCAQLCETDSQCATGFICGNDAYSEICVAGARTDAPSITGIDGDSPIANGENNAFDHYLRQAVVVNGVHFQGADVAFTNPFGQRVPMTVDRSVANQLRLTLPQSLSDEGEYRLVVHSAAGAAEQTFRIMRGEIGETGFPGATHISRVVLFGTTAATDHATTAILVENAANQISNSQTFSATEGAGVLLTAVNSGDHTLLTNPAAGTWVTTSADLYNALDGLSRGTFVLLAGRGALNTWFNTSSAESTLATLLRQQFGVAYGIHLLAASEAFVFAGRKGLTAGNGVFIAGTSSVHASVSLVDDDIIGSSTENFGMCASDGSNCTIPVNKISGTLALNQLPTSVSSLASSITTTTDQGITTVTTPGPLVATGAITAAGFTSTSGTVSTTSGNISTTSGAISTASGNISTTSGTVSAKNGVFSTFFIAGDFDATSNDVSTSACTIGATSGMVWNSGTNHNNHCYAAINNAANISWYAAQLQCNKWGAHLATVLTQDELNFLNAAVLPIGSDHWVGLSDYEVEGTARCVGVEGQIAGPLSITNSGGINCVSVQKNGSPETTSAATKVCTTTDGGVKRYLCEKRVMPLTQQCVPGFWPINGGRICMTDNMQTIGKATILTNNQLTNADPLKYENAVLGCQLLPSAAAHLCTMEEINAACASGMNPSSQYDDNTAERTLTPGGSLFAGERSDHPTGGDASMYFANPRCELGINSTVSTLNGGVGKYRCCY